MNQKTAVGLIIAVAVVAGVAIFATYAMNYDGADVTVYTDDGISVTKSGDALQRTTLTASMKEGYTFYAWFDEKGNVLSTDISVTKYLSDGDKIYAYSTKLVSQNADAAFDVKEMFGVTGDGTVSVSKSAYNGAEATVDGSSVTLPGIGVYTVTYTDSTNNIHRCARTIVDGDVSVTYKWSYSDSVVPTIGKFIGNLTLKITYSDYVHYTDIYLGDRSGHYLNNGETDESIKHDLSYMTYDDVQNKYLKQISDYIKSNTTGKSEQYVANVILEFCQASSDPKYTNFIYTSDEDAHGISEYWQFPLETLFLKTGDCEDTSMLFCALANYMGYDTCTFIFEGHMAAGISLENYTPTGTTSDKIYKGAYGWELTTGKDLDGDEIKTMFYYCESTNYTYNIGEIPKDVYEDYIRGFPLHDTTVKNADVNLVASDDIQVSAITNASGMTTMIATINEGTDFVGWYNENGELLSTDLKYTAEIPKGAKIYAFSGCSNSDHPVKSGEIVNLSEVTGKSGSGTWTVLTEGADLNGNKCSFSNPGSYLVSYTSDGNTWVGTIYVYADITVYTGNGNTATVSAYGNHTGITVSGNCKVYGDFEIENKGNVYYGDLENGDVAYVLDDTPVNGNTAIKPGQSVDLKTLCGISGSGIWKVMSSSFEDLSSHYLKDAIFTPDFTGIVVITYTDGEIHWCGYAQIDTNGLYYDFDVSGWYAERGVFGYSKVKFTGSILMEYISYNGDRNAHFMKQTYSWSNGNSGESYYWTDESDLKEYSESYKGTSELISKVYGTVTCDVWEVSYLNDSGYTVVETQYIGLDGYPLYAISVNWTSKGTTYQNYEYVLKDYGFKENVIETPNIVVYSDVYTTVTSEGGNYYGETITFTTNVADDVEFIGWYDDEGNLISSDQTYSCYAIGTIKLYAVSENKLTAMTEEPRSIYDYVGITPGSGTVTILNDDFSAITDGSITLNGANVTFHKVNKTYIVIYDEGDIHLVSAVHTDGYITKSFNWSYDGIEYNLDLDILYSDYYHYVTAYSVSQRKIQQSTFSGFTSSDVEKNTSFVDYDDVQYKYIKQIVDYIKAQTNGKDDQYVANVILKFCQTGGLGNTSTSIIYQYDETVHGKGASEYWQFPLETLYLQTGDCEDTAILFCAIAKYMGYDSCLYMMNGHAAAGIALSDFTPSSNTDSAIDTTKYGNTVDNVNFYYCETTTNTWDVGDVWKKEFDTVYGTFVIKAA